MTYVGPHGHEMLWPHEAYDLLGTATWKARWVCPFWVDEQMPVRPDPMPVNATVDNNAYLNAEQRYIQTETTFGHLVGNLRYGFLAAWTFGLAGEDEDRDESEFDWEVVGSREWRTSSTLEAALRARIGDVLIRNQRPSGGLWIDAASLRAALREFGPEYPPFDPAKMASRAGNKRTHDRQAIFDLAREMYASADRPKNISVAAERIRQLLEQSGKPIPDKGTIRNLLGVMDMLKK